MPIIASFSGIYVRMYVADHGPPHIHVECEGQEAMVGIDDGQILEGRLPRRAAALVRRWCLDHQQALQDNWALAQALRALSRIPGANHD